jgi:hypothetical protein
MSSLDPGVVGNCSIASLIDRGGLNGVLDRGMLDASSLVLAEIGLLGSDVPRPEALELFDNLPARRNPVGLLSEDIDPIRGELSGTFPQTYSRVGSILSAMRLSRSWEEGLWHAS